MQLLPASLEEELAAMESKSFRQLYLLEFCSLLLQRWLFQHQFGPRILQARYKSDPLDSCQHQSVLLTQRLVLQSNLLQYRQYLIQKLEPYQPVPSCQLQ